MGKNEELAKKIFSVIRMENAKERIVLQVAHPMDKQAMGQNEEHAKNILSVTRMETAKERMLGSLPMLQAQVASKSRNHIRTVHFSQNTKLISLAHFSNVVIKCTFFTKQDKK